MWLNEASCFEKAVSKSNLRGATVGIITGQTANVKTDVVLSWWLLVAPGWRLRVAAVVSKVKKRSSVT